ncbi:hypothetical protein ACIA8G_08390 [Lentzea sp. NPDC051213]|uniref:hypothetical protein n=1 Tax=Lentzea sp. NPDC051213 TaxID=3364126 RepID=UPI00379BFB13
MRNHLTIGRRFAVVVALLVIAVFVLHPACPPEPSHHGASTPGLSAELCHHGEVQHLSAETPALAAVQAGTPTAVDLDAPAVAWSPVVATSTSCPWRPERGSSGRTLLIDIGISRT